MKVREDDDRLKQTRIRDLPCGLPFRFFEAAENKFYYCMKIYNNLGFRLVRNQEEKYIFIDLERGEMIYLDESWTALPLWESECLVR